MDNRIPPQPAIDERPLEPRKREAPGKGTNLFRSPARVAFLSVIGFATYPFWWRWQLFKFARREGFPRAKSYWWTLVPLYGWVVIWEQLDDLKRAAAERKIVVRPGLILSLFVAGSLALAFSGWSNTGLLAGTALLTTGVLLTALSIYLGQRSVVGYLAATYPEERRRRVSAGEIIAALLTTVIVALGAGLIYYLNDAEMGTAVAYLPPATPVTGATLHSGWALFRDQPSGFAIELPPEWSSVAYDTVARGEPPTRQLKFYAEANNKSANLAVRRWVTAQLSLDEYLAEHQAALERIGAGNISHSRVTLPLGQAELVRFTQTFSDSAGSETDQFMEFVVLRDRGFRVTVYRIQFGTSGSITDMEDTFRAIAATFRLA